MNESAETGRRFDAGSWAALIYALAIGLGTLLFVIGAARIPSDGWLYGESPDGNGVVLQTNLAGRASPLQPGDQIIAVEGLTYEVLLDRAHAFYALQAPPWTDGQPMRYTVLRNTEELTEELTVAVPLHRIATWTNMLGLLRSQGPFYLVQIASSLFFFAVGVAVFLLRPRERAAHALLILGSAFLFQAIPMITSVTTAFFPFLPYSVGFDYWSAAILPSIVYLMLVFPVARWPVSRFPRLAPLVIYATPTLSLNLLYLLNHANRSGYEASSSVVYIGEALATMILLLVWLPYAAITLRGQVERAQFVWMSLGLLSFILPGIGGWVLLFLGVLSTEGGGAAVGNALSTIGWSLMSVCLAIAITRYRLFDIDVIIRRTLVYGALTLTLGATYLVSIVGLQTLFVRFTGQESTLAVVVSTLAIAALFGPLRAWVQAVIDRRFFRKKYDAQQVLAQFAQRAQQESDLDTVSADILATVQEALEPERATLWLVKRPEVSRLRRE